MPEARGSEKLYQAYRTRTITDESVKEISRIIDEGPGTVEDAAFYGGREATGMSMTVAFDEGEGCGNDLLRILGWLHHTDPPKVNGVIIFPYGILAWDHTRVVITAGQTPSDGPVAGGRSATAQR